MRNAFADEITKQARHNKRIVLLSGDIGNRLFNEYKAECPDRFYNCGVAESNMVGMAAGLAMSGLRPICYTITPFITYRCMEQIRVDLCYHCVPVVIVGTGSGLSYASLGATHHSCEEIGMLRLLPELAVLAPADQMEVRACLKAALNYDKPVYMRIGKKGEPLVHEEEPDVTIGESIEIREGSDLCILSAGNMLPTALAASDILAGERISCAVISFHTIKPLDLDRLASVFTRFRGVATLEEHSIHGGLGGSVAEWLSEQNGALANLTRFGTSDSFLHETSNQEEARAHFGLTPEAIAGKLLHKSTTICKRKNES